MEILDHVFDVLSEERRRYALYELEQQDSPVPIDEVVERIAEWETNGAAESIPEEKFERIELEFYHQDLPKTSDLRTCGPIAKRRESNSPVSPQRSMLSSASRKSLNGRIGTHNRQQVAFTEGFADTESGRFNRIPLRLSTRIYW